MSTTTLPRLRLSLVCEGTMPSTVIRSPIDVSKYLNDLRSCSEEQFWAIHLNAKSNVIGTHIVSHGTLSASLVHPREIFKAAMLNNSHSLILAHNHPSGASIEPSPDDLATTVQLVQASKIMGMEVLDHVIVGPRLRSFYSIRERYSEIWSQH